MFTKQMKLTIVILLLISICLYGIQIMIFRDPATTEFYLLQDLAFMPITIIIATIVVGEILNEKEKRERESNTRMLTSTFYTQVGASFMNMLIQASENEVEIRNILQKQVNTEKEIKQMQEEVKQLNCQIHLTEDIYREVTHIVSENRMAILVLSSNPMILEQRSFTNLLWGMFHLEDEFRIRGAYHQLSQEDKAHIAEDLEKVLQLLLLNSIPNAKYLKDTYPHLYKTAQVKLTCIEKRQ